METDHYDQLARRLDEVVRLLAVVARRGVRQTDLISELGSLGFPPKRIAQLVGTTANVVSVTLDKNKRTQTRRSRDL